MPAAPNPRKGVHPWVGFIPVEEHQVGAILGYQDEHPGTRYPDSFADGESYVCVYFTSCE